MAKKYYFDTSIWLDIYEARGYNGQKAKTLMEKIVLEDSVVVYSDIVEQEFKKLKYPENEINRILRIAKPDNIKRVQSTKSQIKEAVRLAKQRKIPYGDGLHAIIARDINAQLVSRDYDFLKLKDITKAKIPEDLI